MSSEHEKGSEETLEEVAATEDSKELPSDKTEEVKEPISDTSSTTLDESEESTKTWPADHAVTEDRESDEAEENEEEKLFNSSRDMFQKVSDYLNGELSMTLEDYTLLEKLNKMTTMKYSDMSVMAQQLHTTMEELNKKCNDLKPFLDQIDQIEKSVTHLEQEAHRLDAYSKRLETKFKKLEKR